MTRASILLWMVVIGCITSAVNAQSSHQEILSLLQDDQFSQALEEIESLPKNDSAKLSYWRAVCLASDGQTAKAIEGCRELVTRWPKAESAKDATQMIEILENLNANSEELTELYFETLERFRKNDGAVQIECSFPIPEKLPYEFRFAIDFKKKRCELKLTNNGSTYMQFQADEKGSRWYYSGGDNQILVFKESFFPVMKFEIEEEADESFKINISGSISSDAKASGSAWSDLLQRKWFSTREGCQKLFVDHLREKAVFPTNVTQKEDVAIGSYAQPDFENGGFLHTKSEFSVDGVLSGNLDSSLRIQVKSGDAETMLEDFEWPEVEVVEQDLDILFVKLFVESLAAFLSKQEVPQTRI